MSAKKTGTGVKQALGDLSFLTPRPTAPVAVEAPQETAVVEATPGTNAGATERIAEADALMGGAPSAAPTATRTTTKPSAKSPAKPRRKKSRRVSDVIGVEVSLAEEATARARSLSRPRHTGGQRYLGANFVLSSYCRAVDALDLEVDMWGIEAGQEDECAERIIAAMRSHFAAEFGVEVTEDDASAA